LNESLSDLQDPDELRELGMAIFLDRPLCQFKGPGEPDQTVLLSYEAFSPTIASRRLRLLLDQAAVSAADQERYLERLDHDLSEAGLPLRPTGQRHWPGTVSLEDAFQVADDFVLVRTTRQSANDFLELFDFTPLTGRFGFAFLDGSERLTIVRAASVGEGGEGILILFDGDLRRRLELQVDLSSGYQRRTGREFPTSGFRVLRVWEPTGATGEMREHDLRSDDSVVGPRS
jgi:hypothetical protein